MNHLSITPHQSYPDKILWRIAYPLIAISFLFVANDNTLVQLLQMPSFYSDILFAIGLSYTIGIYIQQLSHYLDKKYPYSKNFNFRLILQSTFGVFLPLFIAMLLECIYLLIIDIPIASSSILRLELPLSLIFLLLINSFYLSCYLVEELKISSTIKKELIEENVTYPIHFFMVQKGVRELRIALSDCAWLVSSNKMLWLQTYQGEQFRIEGTLEEWENKLKTVNFYRLNRQYLVAPLAIQSVTQTETRKLKIQLVFSTEEEVFVSKPNARAFKEWWKNACPS